MCRVLTFLFPSQTAKGSILENKAITPTFNTYKHYRQKTTATPVNMIIINDTATLNYSRCINHAAEWCRKGVVKLGSDNQGLS